MATRIELVAILIAASLLASPALAHKGEVKRRLLLEAAPHELLEVLVEVRVSGRDRSRALWLLADADKNGKLDRGEEDRLAAELGARGLDGVRILVGSSTITLDSIETKVRAEREGPTVLLLHGRATLPPDERRIWVKTGLGADPLELVLLPGTRPFVPRRRAKRAPDGLLTLTLGAGDRVRVDIGVSPVR